MDPTQTNPPSDQTDNNQSEYQKILDKYAQELAATENTAETTAPTPPPEPVMPPQFSEAVPAPTADQHPEVPAEPIIAPQPLEASIPQSLVAETPVSEDLALIPPQTPESNQAQTVNPVFPPQEPPLLTPQPVAPIESTPILPPVETSLPHEVPPQIPEVAPPIANNPVEPASIRQPLTDVAAATVVAAAAPVKSNSSSVAKYFFIVSLLIFLATAGVVVYTFLQNQNLTKNNTNVPVNTVNITPTVAISAGAVCTLNDQTYQSGQSFQAQDGCNTCTCLENGTISCTEKDCTDTTKGGLSVNEASSSADTSPTPTTKPKK